YASRIAVTVIGLVTNGTVRWCGEPGGRGRLGAVPARGAGRQRRRGCGRSVRRGNAPRRAERGPPERHLGRAPDPAPAAGDGRTGRGAGAVHVLGRGDGPRPVPGRVQRDEGVPGVVR